MKDHLADLYGFYGEDTGQEIARKHIMVQHLGLVGSAQFRRIMNTLPTVQEQIAAIDEFFAGLADRDSRLVYTDPEEFPQELAA